MEKKMGIKVVATRQGYYGQLLNEGQLFEIEKEQDFSERWMKKFDDRKDKAAKPAPRRRKPRKSAVIEEPKTLKDVTDAESDDADNWV